MDNFTAAFLECLFWCSTNDQSESGDENFQDYSIEDLDLGDLAEIIEECEAFQEDNSKLLSLAGDDSQNGHDFCLTRNGHGAGFWDRGYPSKVGDALSDASRVYGTLELYLGDNGKLYTQG